MSLTLTTTVKLEINSVEKRALLSEMRKYIAGVNAVVALAQSGVSIKKFSSKDVDAELPSAIRGQIARDARSVIATHKKRVKKVKSKEAFLEKIGKLRRPLKEPRMPVLRLPVLLVNNQNFKLDLERNEISFPMWVNGESKRVPFRVRFVERHREILAQTPHLGTLRIVRKNDEIFAQIGYEMEIQEVEDVDFLSISDVSTPLVMGVDLGIKCPAVAYVNDGTVRFYGNGRQNQFKRRKFYARRQKLQKAKKLRAIKRISNKEERFMRDIDHKISRAIVNEAMRRGVKVLALEDLDGIRENCAQSTRKSRKNVGKPKKSVTSATEESIKGKVSEDVQLSLFEENAHVSAPNSSDTFTSKKKKRKLTKKQAEARRKRNRMISSWSFWRLSKYISYKAALAGIAVVFVDPHYTSQTCPVCGEKHKTKTRKYECSCGFRGHRDIVGAMNIARATYRVGEVA